ncbi:Mbeg1-like protein [Streptococcus phocae subsp. phocae]
MATLVDYVTHNQETSFTKLALNELDIAVINEIGYLPFDGLIGQASYRLSDMTLANLIRGNQDAFGKPVYNFLITKERLALFLAVSQSKRFANLSLSNYVNDINVEFEKQFAAMVFTIDTINHVQIVFRGTDDSLIGWKEDFKLTYMREVPAHRSAIAYLKTFQKEHPNCDVTISGHSKGGNLALYASSFLSPYGQSFIKRLYLFDAPGLPQSQLKHSGYRAIRDKLTVIQPHESVVGVMLYYDVPLTIVRSLSYGLLQHKICNWLVDLGGTFETVAERSALSLHLEVAFRDWTRDLSKSELKLIGDAFFDTLIASGITSLNAFTFDEKAMGTIFRAIYSLHSIDHRKKALMITSMRKLIGTYTGYRKRQVSEKMLSAVSHILKSPKSFKKP